MTFLIFEAPVNVPFGSFGSAFRFKFKLLSFVSPLKAPGSTFSRILSSIYKLTRLPQSLFLILHNFMYKEKFYVLGLINRICLEKQAWNRLLEGSRLHFSVAKSSSHFSNGQTFLEFIYNLNQLMKIDETFCDFRKLVIL